VQIYYLSRAFIPNFISTCKKVILRGHDRTGADCVEEEGVVEDNGIPLYFASGGISFAILSNFTTGLLGCAPTPSQYRIRSTLHSIFFCTTPSLTSRGTGSYTPNTSRGFASRAFRTLTATSWRCVVDFVWPGGRASLIRTTISILSSSVAVHGSRREGEFVEVSAAVFGRRWRLVSVYVILF